jgi:hypothetical protein
MIGRRAIDDVEVAAHELVTLAESLVEAEKHVPLPFGAAEDLAAANAVVAQIDAYRAFQGLGHALHAVQDFFAHSNYVELFTGVTPGYAIASVKRPGSSAFWRPRDIQLPSPPQFTLAGLHEFLVQEYEHLQTGNLSTRWLGEDDACASSRSSSNPVTTLSFSKETYEGSVVEAFSIAPGVNPDPQSGFDYCHYKTSTNGGLNKDVPCQGDPRNVTSPARCDEPSHVNFYFARKAAMKMSGSILDFAFRTRFPHRQTLISAKRGAPATPLDRPGRP